jgi:cellulose synthase/poly-beta-1,6-N-acetylglucosamine synthase-like glycosyltransferase
MLLRYSRAVKSPIRYTNEEFSGIENRIVVILPFRNEREVLPLTLPNLITEISSDRYCHLVLVDSSSRDDSANVAKSVLNSSSLGDGSWTLTISDLPGKGRALNIGMSLVKDNDIVVLVDADALVPEGALGGFRRWFYDEEIAAVSALESVSPIHPMSSYKTRSNIIREYESSIGSTPVLEGSLLAWRPSKIGWQGFNELSNADDAQIALSTIRSGLRSIVDPTIQYSDVRNEPGFGLKRSIRRSQGLSYQFLTNIDLLWRAPDRSFRTCYFFTLLMHFLVPWAVLLLIFLPLASIVSADPGTSINIMDAISIMPSIIVLASLLTTTGRTLAKGSIATVLSHLRVLLRIKTHQWEPGKG